MLYALHSTALINRSRGHLMTAKYNNFHKIISKYGRFEKKTTHDFKFKLIFFNITHLCNVMFHFSKAERNLTKAAFCIK